MQSIPLVQLKSKANTLLINYAENEMPRFPASLAGRRHSHIPPAPPAPLRTQIPFFLTSPHVYSAHTVLRVFVHLCGSAGASSACNSRAGAAVVQMFDSAAPSRGAASHV